MSAIKILIILSISIFAVHANAEIYRQVDENGKVTFSDRSNPSTNNQAIEKVDIQQTNTTPAIKPRANTPSKDTDESGEISYKVTIISPSTDSHITNEQRHLTVRTKITPSPDKDLQLSALVNGAKFESQKSQGSEVTLFNIHRGQQKIQVQLRNKKGKVISKSQTITINVHRPRAR